MSGGSLREILERHVASGYTTGAVALVGRGDSAEVAVAGVLDTGAMEPMAPDSIFRIASLTKPVAAAAVMMVIEDGRLGLSDTVDALLPELAARRVLRTIGSDLDDTVPATRAITVEDVLTNRMGLGVLMAEHGSLPILREIARLGLRSGFGPPQPSDPLDFSAWLERVGTLPLMAQPGERWLYSTASAVQGILVERASGMPFPQFLAERIFAPLGMQDTAFDVPPAKLERLPSQYRPENDALVLIDDRRKSEWARPPAFPGGDAGLASTADDYFAFSRWLLNRGRLGTRRLLKESSVDAMTCNHLTPAQMSDGAMILGQQQGWGYGLSPAVRATPRGLPRGSYGWTGGYGTSWIADPDGAVTVLVMTQTAFTNPRPPRIHQDVWRYVFRPAG